MPERRTLNRTYFCRGSSANLPRLHTCKNKVPFWDYKQFAVTEHKLGHYYDQYNLNEFFQIRLQPESNAGKQQWNPDLSHPSRFLLTVIGFKNWNEFIDNRIKLIFDKKNQGSQTHAEELSARSYRKDIPLCSNVSRCTQIWMLK